MSIRQIDRKKRLSQLGLFLLVIILLLGVFFRFANLDKKIYWVDEVATSLRISGYTRQEVTQKIAHSGFISPADLQRYQRLSSEKDLGDTLDALIKSPEQAPLYYLLARFWVQLLGNSVTVIRSLSTVLSLLAFPCLYWLCWELFKSSLVGWIAIALLAVSPFYVAYAQEARPYSLWTVMLLLSGTALLRAMRFNNRLNWCFYTVTVILGFYTSLLSLLVAIGHSSYVLALERFRLTKIVRNYLAALSWALIAFIPWFIVVAHNWQRLQDNTIWMRVPMEIPYIIAIWLYSIVSIFIESPIYKALDFIIITRVVIDLSLLTLISFSFYYLRHTTPKRIWLFILNLTLFPLLILILIDLILSGQSSATTRYLIPCYLSILLALSHLFADKFYAASVNFRQPRNWKIIFTILISISIASCFYSLDKSPLYQKTRNLSNPAIAAIVNQAQSPILLAEPKEVLDILSLSYILEPKVRIQVLSKTNIYQSFYGCQSVFLFNPSSDLRNKISKEKKIKLEQAYQPKLLKSDEISLSLWKAGKLSNNCNQSENLIKHLEQKEYQ